MKSKNLMMRYNLQTTFKLNTRGVLLLQKGEGHSLCGNATTQAATISVQCHVPSILLSVAGNSERCRCISACAVAGDSLC